MLTSRQIKESDKRMDKIHHLLTEAFEHDSTSIDYKDCYMYFKHDGNEWILGYFWDYKSLKKLQDGAIQILSGASYGCDLFTIVNTINNIKR